MSPLASQIRQACRLEALARKPGNVHPEADFGDLTCDDFLASADAAAPWLARSAELGVGRSIEAAIQATRQVVRSNTNLGIALLIAPLAAVPPDRSLFDGVAAVLDSLTVDDARCVYRAIRLATPGGLGTAENQDAASDPTVTLLEAMSLAADRDRVARQYAGYFNDVLSVGRDMLSRWWKATDGDWESAVIHLHLSLMALFPDSLIARKCGKAVAEESSRRAHAVMHAGPLSSPERRTALHDFDAWLRADGN
ncbi:MAG: triphosphoribosyl-dephospho-CoA synthase, partial [Planctomycetaceae bacterium]|nr:triphosphoribosyl-dephospho-CoA synthase [Planctomycetaceae bacterium]